MVIKEINVKLQYEAVVDLNSVYYVPGRTPLTPFYCLDTSGGKEKKMFRLVAQLEFVDETQSQEFTSDPFQLKTEPRKILFMFFSNIFFNRAF